MLIFIFYNQYEFIYIYLNKYIYYIVTRIIILL